MKTCIVYEFVCRSTNEKYIGVSVMPIHAVLSTHLYQFNLYKKGLRSHRDIFDIIEKVNYEINVIDTAEKNYALALKEYYRKIYNKPKKPRVTFTPRKYPVKNTYALKKRDWYLKNKDRLNEKMRAYYNKNKETICQKRRNQRILKKLAEISP